MHIYRLNIKSFDREKQLYLFAFILSLLFHILFLVIFKSDLFVIDLTSDKEEIKDDITVLFPENKPRQIVENTNENNEVPDYSDLLSDLNSKARNQTILGEPFSQPFSEGNIAFPNLTNPDLSPVLSKSIPGKKFSKEALINDNNEKESNNLDLGQNQPLRNAIESLQSQQTTNNIYNQNKFSVDQLGDISLSTYAWEWAPYINALKRKLTQVWFAPAAYNRLGLIYGYTVIQFSITKDGNLMGYTVLEHKGHESLEQSSVNAIKSTFPFKPLPDHFPDDYLTITARLIYPNLRERIP